MSTDSHKSLSTQVSHFDNVSRISDQVMQHGSARVGLHSIPLHHWFIGKSKDRLRLTRLICTEGFKGGFRSSLTQMEMTFCLEQETKKPLNYIYFYFYGLFFSMITITFIQKAQRNLVMDSYFSHAILFISHDESC